MSAPARVVLSIPLFGATPGTPVVTPGGANNSVTYTYKLVGVDAVGGTTAAGAGGSTAVGATALDATNKNVITWTDPVGASFVRVYRTVGGLTQGLIATVAVGVATLDDSGLVGDGATAPTANTTGVGTQATLPSNLGAAVWLEGTFVGTVQVQTSPDGTDFYNTGTALTAPGFVTLPVAVAVRLKMTAYTSGTPVATLLHNRP